MAAGEFLQDRDAPYSTTFIFLIAPPPRTTSRLSQAQMQRNNDLWGTGNGSSPGSITFDGVCTCPSRKCSLFQYTGVTLAMLPEGRGTGHGSFPQALRSHFGTKPAFAPSQTPDSRRLGYHGSRALPERRNWCQMQSLRVFELGIERRSHRVLLAWLRHKLNKRARD